MNQQKINRISGVIPIVMSLVAFGVVIVAVLTGWGKGDADEGAGAHIFQLLIAAQVPFILIYIATADWRKLGRVTGLMALQASGLVLAIGSVGFFKL